MKKPLRTAVIGALLAFFVFVQPSHASTMMDAATSPIDQLISLIQKIENILAEIQTQTTTPHSLDAAAAQTLTPAVTFTANGSQAVTVPVGSTVQYAWNSTNAASATSTFTEDSSSCGLTGTGPFPWIAGTLSGSTSGTTASCHIGHTYTVTYSAMNQAGQSASASVSVHVTGANTPGSCSLNGQSIANGGSVTAYQTATVPYGSVCAAQQRTCTNGSLSGTYPYASCDEQIAATTTQVWHVDEITLHASSTYAYGYTDVDVNAVFAGPNGQTIARPAFWDGGNTWKIRFAPTSTGTWTYRISSTNPSDTGLKAIGSVNAVAYAGSLPVYQRGFVKSEPGHYLTYGDGTPFFWMGASLYGVVSGKLNESNKTNWNPVPAHPNSQVLGTIDQLVTQRFNLVDYSFYGPWQNNVQGQISTSIFDTFYDPVIEYTASRGLTMNLALLHGDMDFMSQTDMNRLVRYLVARYGAYPVVWHVSQPDMPDGTTFLGATRPSGYATLLGQAMAYAASLDGYHHPMGPWYENTAVNQTPTLYLDQNWTNVIESQCGHYPTWGGTQATSVYYYYYFNYYSVPMIEAGGCNYTKTFDQITDYVSRRSAWRAVQSGSSGFTYGANGVYTMTWDTSVPSWYGGPVVPWYTAIDTPSSWQMRWLRSFYEALPWPSMIPRPSSGTYANYSIMTLSGTAVSDLSQPLARADLAMTTVAVYFPAEFPAGAYVTLKGLASQPYTAQWYNPSTGTYTLINATVVPTQGTWRVPAKPDSNDWVLLLKENATAPAPTATLTVNGSTSVTVPVGATLNTQWSSQNGVSAASTYTEDSASCGLTGTGPFPWIASTLQGTNSSVTQTCHSGHTYVITYTVTGASGKKTNASISVHVN